MAMRCWMAAIARPNLRLNAETREAVFRKPIS
jgi:hypothetical protein